MFYEFVSTDVCNIADDTTPFACGMELSSVIERLENDITSVIYWFSANFMVLNAPKCHFSTAGVQGVSKKKRYDFEMEIIQYLFKFGI